MKHKAIASRVEILTTHHDKSLQRIQNAVQILFAIHGGNDYGNSSGLA